jgi:tRNA A37 methylthiotransferase MiaB
VREARFAAGYSFKYSNRPGTPGSLLGKQVPEAVSSERLQALQAVLQETVGRRSTAPARAASWMCCSRSRAARRAS